MALVLGTMAVAIVATQWPFEYRATEFAVRVRWNRIDWSWFPRTHAGTINRDFVLNLMMLMPLGAGYALARRAAALRVFVESIVLGGMFSAALELAQLATRSRYTSFPDLWRNTLGCAVACAVVLMLRRASRSHD